MNAWISWECRYENFLEYMNVWNFGFAYIDTWNYLRECIFECMKILNLRILMHEVLFLGYERAWMNAWNFIFSVLFFCWHLESIFFFAIVEFIWHQNFVFEKWGVLLILMLLLKLRHYWLFPLKHFNACAWICGIESWWGLKRNWDLRALDMLSFACPYKRKNSMQGIHATQDCSSFDVLGWG